jgi:hypothetical protein
MPHTGPGDDGFCDDPACYARLDGGWDMSCPSSYDHIYYTEKERKIAALEDEVARLRLITDTRYKEEGRATFLIDWLDPRRLVITGPTGREDDAIKAAVGLIQVCNALAEDLYNKSERGE